MDTPILDFVRAYAASDTARFHMPGHKGRGILGCEAFDITEIHGADALYEAEGIIAQSEANATDIFGTQRTLYSTEGSSQCIRAMLYLALTNRREGASPVVVAARNVHKAFVYAAAVLDFEVEWLWPEEGSSLCSCPISPQQLSKTLSELDATPAAVYITSPDYLGGMADIPALAEVCRRHGVPLLVDNAHGAYLRFLPVSAHPMDLGADMCCDSAHKTLPVLTGGAYLHISKNASAAFAEHAKSAMALFGSTSPSYLTLASLDGCNGILSESYPARLAQWSKRIDEAKAALASYGWCVEERDTLRITLRASVHSSGVELAETLRREGIECEYADDSHIVLMLTPENSESDVQKLLRVLGKNQAPVCEAAPLPRLHMEKVLSIREALFAPHELIPTEAALGRICGAPTVSCPPAIPIAVSGERISEEAVELFRIYGIEKVDVLK